MQLTMKRMLAALALGVALAFGVIGVSQVVSQQPVLVAPGDPAGGNGGGGGG